MYNLLTEPLIRYKTDSGELQTSTLPQVYAALVADDVASFPALRPHQRHAWHAFLVQLGAMALHRSGKDGSDLPSDADEWAALIRGLTLDYPEDEPWQLLVDDITKPGFMQPPASSKDKEKELGTKSIKRKGQYIKVPDEEKICRSPDELDIISTSRNHDVKTGSTYESEVDSWIFSLINVQTMDGRPGSGYYGVSRMNSNDGSRTAFSLTPSLRWGVHVVEDIAGLLEADFSSWPMRWDGVKLLWTKVWDGIKSEALTLSELHPFYLEVCRRCRVRKEGMRIYVEKGPQVSGGGSRVNAHASRGNVGDPWTLVTGDDKGPKALTMQKDSFSYQNITAYLFTPEWKLPVLFSLPNPGSECDSWLVARALRRKKGGQTEGYYERIIPLRPRIANVFGKGGDRKELGDIAKRRVSQIGKVEGVLRYAVAIFFVTGEDISKWKPRDRNRALYREEITDRVNSFTSIIDDHFFEHLQTEFEETLIEERDQIRSAWLQDFVIPSAETVLEDSWVSLPCPENQRLRTESASKNFFNGRIYQEFEIPIN